MSNTNDSKATIACAVAEMVENKIGCVIHKDAYFMLSYLILANSRPRFLIEYELWSGVGDVLYYEFETYDDEWYRIMLIGEQYHYWLSVPWPVRAFVACYNDAIKSALQGIDKLDAIIQHEKEKA